MLFGKDTRMMKGLKAFTDSTLPGMQSFCMTRRSRSSIDISRGAHGSLKPQRVHLLAYSDHALMEMLVLISVTILSFRATSLREGGSPGAAP